MFGGLRRVLIEPGSQAANLVRRGVCRGETHGGVRVERVYLDESGPEHEIAILCRDLILGGGITACLAGKSNNHSFKPIYVEIRARTPGHARPPAA